MIRFVSKRWGTSLAPSFALGIALSFMSINATFAQSNEHFGDSEQPGNRLHTRIADTIDTGVPQAQAITDSIDKSLTNYDTTLSGEAKSAVAFDMPIADEFYVEMLDMNSLIDVTKVLIETHSSKAVHVITLGVTLYPDYAQEVYEGASLTGVMNADDVLVAAIQAGADPSSISPATAAGPAAPLGAIPLGAGIGAGGTGGGDTTTSTN